MHLIFYKLCEFSRGHITQLIFVTPSLGWNTKSHMKTWQLELIPPKFTRHAHIIWYKASDHLIILHRHSTFPWRVFGLTPPPFPFPPNPLEISVFVENLLSNFFSYPWVFMFSHNHTNLCSRCIQTAAGRSTSTTKIPVEITIKCLRWLLTLV